MFTLDGCEAVGGHLLILVDRCYTRTSLKRINGMKRAERSEFFKTCEKLIMRTRYVDNATEENIRAVLRCCRPLDFCCSRNICNSGTLSCPVLGHYPSIFGCLQLRNRSNYDTAKESQVHAIILQFLAWSPSVQDVVFGVSVDFHIITITFMLPNPM